MTLRLPSFELSWAKTAAKPAVSSSATGISASSSRLRARVIRATPWPRSISSSSLIASSRERRPWPVTASLRFSGSDSVCTGAEYFSLQSLTPKGSS